MMMVLRRLFFLLLLMVIALNAAWGEDTLEKKPGYFQVSDTAGLLSAVSKIGAEGGTIVLQPGTYTIKDPIVFQNSNVNVTGTGWNTVIKKQGDGDALVFKGSLWSCSVRNLTVEGDANAKIGSGIVFRDGEFSGICVVDYCQIRFFAESGISFEGNREKPFSSNTVSKCWFMANLGDQLYSRFNNDFYITENQFGAPLTRTPRTGVFLDHSSAGTYTKNYHWSNTVALRMSPGSHFNRIENNRFEQSREQGILIGDPNSYQAAYNIIIGNTIHTNSENNLGKFSAVEAYNAEETTFCQNQVYSWTSDTQKTKHALVLGKGCKTWIVKDNIFRHCTEAPLVYDKKAGHIVKDNLMDEPKR